MSWISYPVGRFSGVHRWPVLGVRRGEDAPVSVAVVFDASASMGRKILQAHEAVSAFLNTANPDDELLLVQFSDQANLLLGLTKTVEEVRERMMYLRPPEEQRY